MVAIPFVRTVLSGAIRASFDPAADALGLACRVEREDWVLYAKRAHSLAVRCEPLQGEVRVRLVRGKHVFDLAHLLDIAGRPEDARVARQCVESPLELPAQFERLAQFAHEMGAFLLSKDPAFLRKAKQSRSASAD